MLYIFGKNDESVGDDWPSSTPWWLADASEDQQKTMLSLRQLQIRNRCGEPAISNTAWSTPDVITTDEPAEHGAPVSWVMYDGGHGWPYKAGVWAVDHFKALAS